MKLIKLSKIDYACIILIVLSFLVALELQSAMPEKMPTHWNAAGEIDGYASRFVGLFLFPIITAFIYLLFLLIPKIAVFKKNIQDFMKYFDYIKLVFVLFMLAVYAATLVQVRNPFNMSYFIMPAMAVMFYVIGWAIGKCKRNYFIGIRTPWTMADDKVWDKTHKLGSITFRLNALVILLGFVLKPEAAIIVFVATVIANVIFLYAYSYVVWKKKAS